MQKELWKNKANRTTKHGKKVEVERFIRNYYAVITNLLNRFILTCIRLTFGTKCRSLYLERISPKTEMSDTKMWIRQNQMINSRIALIYVCVCVCGRILYGILMWTCFKMKFHSIDKMCLACCSLYSIRLHTKIRQFYAMHTTNRKATWGNYYLSIGLHIK